MTTPIAGRAAEQALNSSNRTGVSRARTPEEAGAAAHLVSRRLPPATAAPSACAAGAWPPVRPAMPPVRVAIVGIGNCAAALIQGVHHYRDGASLRPVPPGGTAKSKDARWIDIHEGDEFDEAQMATWVKQAAALPGWVP
jgi:hypothetical protein